MSATNKFESIQGAVDHHLESGDDLKALLKEARRPLKTKPCVFLSHYGKDKAAVIEIGKYFDSVGVDYYLDIKDANLQHAVSDDDQALITQFIELGIMNSTHLLTILSDETKKSWWVPYEIGYAKRDGVMIAHLLLRDVQGKLPEFLNITEKLSGIIALNAFIEKRQKEKPLYQKRQFDILIESLGFEESIVGHDTPNHPLSGVLNL